MAQSEDDLYYVSSKNQKATSVKSTTSTTPTKQNNSATTVVNVKSPSNSTVVVRRHNTTNRNTRNVDEYNRRYDTNAANSDNSDYNNGNDVNDNDTLFIDEYNNNSNKGSRRTYSRNNDSDLDGQWVDDFDGTDDDYEYATRIIRFRNPRFAVSISSPYYWDLVYGCMNSWDLYTR